MASVAPRATASSTWACRFPPALRSTQGAPVWMYEFRDQTAVPLFGIFGGAYRLSLPQGAAHALLAQFLGGDHVAGDAGGAPVDGTSDPQFSLNVTGLSSLTASKGFAASPLVQGNITTVIHIGFVHAILGQQRNQLFCHRTRHCRHGRDEGMAAQRLRGAPHAPRFLQAPSTRLRPVPLPLRVRRAP